MLDQAPLQSLTGYVKRHHFKLCQTNQFEKYLSRFKTDSTQITLVIHAGPLHLGTYILDPWYLQIRPFAAALGLEVPPHSIRSLLKTSGSL